mgnify:CR=1 FL=1
MAPSQTLKWIESGKSPSEQDVEIQGTEPYIVGGHTASGYWVNTGRETTVKGLYAAGDVAGGCPQKYVTGALAEGKLAALDMVKQFKAGTLKEADIQTETEIKVQEGEILSQYEKFRNEDAPAFSVEELEEAMQKSWMNMREELLLIISLMRSSLLLQMKKSFSFRLLPKNSGSRYA